MKTMTLLISIFTLNITWAATSTKIDWSRAENSSGRQYKSSFENEAQRIQQGESYLMAGRYMMINPGCGTECQIIGYLDTKTGITYITKFQSSYGIKFSANSPILIVNPKEEIESAFGSSGGPSWLKTEIYEINDQAELKPIVPKR